jgi:hypothetical protein
LCLAGGFALDICLGDGLIGGAGIGCGSGGLRADGTVFALAVEEQPAPRRKNEGGDNENC